ncbi:MAG: hypothetical protein KKA05_07515 [Alphaproteobacteria bacterium]|nr:hypothetical protein [Alphaproteobacteria bacterium]MBU0859687.1 hypothetical protein [Alphaproteobacteria bacterium]
MAQEVMCVFFRASDGKRPGDVSRNIARIDALTHGASASMMTDPRDSSQYLLAFPPGTAEETVLQVTRALDRLSDPTDNAQLLEAWHGKVSAQSLGTHVPQKLRMG